jgi:hypothetical protein
MQKLGSAQRRASVIRQRPIGDSTEGLPSNAADFASYNSNTKQIGYSVKIYPTPSRSTTVEDLELGQSKGAAQKSAIRVTTETAVVCKANELTP